MVFNTGMTGYQETLTDPSYCRQIVAMTAPHIGNTGVNDEDPESRQVWVSGYVVREPARLASSWRATRDLDAYLRAEGVPGIAVRGTRLLTRRVREQGAMRAAISTVETSPEKLLERVLASPQMTGADLARVVSTLRAVHDLAGRACPVPRGRRRPGHQSLHAAPPCHPGLRSSRGTRHHDRRPDPRRSPGWRVLQQRPRRPGRRHVRGGRDAGGAGRRAARLRHLPGQPDPRPGPGPAHLQAAVRAPRREPARHGPRHRAGLHHQPQPRLRRRAAG